MTNFDVNPTSMPSGVTNLKFNILFITPPENEVVLTSKFVRSFSLWRSLELAEHFPLKMEQKFQNCAKYDISCQTPVPDLKSNRQGRFPKLSCYEIVLHSKFQFYRVAHF